MMPGSVQAVRKRKKNMATTEMKKMTVMAGADFKFYSATKMQKGMRMPSEQHQMQSIP